MRATQFFGILGSIALAASCGNDTLHGQPTPPSSPPPPTAPPPPDPPLIDPPPPDPQLCWAQDTINGQLTYRPTDIIWVVDSSDSMDTENQLVQAGLNAFSLSITAAGIDHRVVLIGDAAQMSVPSPLGGSASFLHVDVDVGSEDALHHIVDQYPAYSGMLRSDSVKHFVAVTDDESDLSAGEFNGDIAALTNPGFGSDWVMHSVVAFGDIPFIGCITGARVGQEYLTLSSQTSGVTASVCEPNWDPIFDAVEAAVQLNAALPCEFDIPALPADTMLDPTRGGLRYHSSNGTITELPRVTGAQDCAADGWYFDDPATPNKMVACPSVCDLLRSDADAMVQILVGCI